MYALQLVADCARPKLYAMADCIDGATYRVRHGNKMMTFGSAFVRLIDRMEGLKYRLTLEENRGFIRSQTPEITGTFALNYIDLITKT